MIRIGIDIGGTFTDFCVWRGGRDDYRHVISHKVPSTPPAFADAVREGLEQILRQLAVDANEPVLVVHGTTVSTNTVIERSGPPIALLVTEGVRDLLGLGRLRLARPVDMFAQRPLPLVPRERVFEVRERLLADGSVDRPLEPQDAVAAARQARAAGCETLCICFLHSYRNPAHERAARAAIASAEPGLDLVLSSEVWPQQAEYERAVVAVLNAYVRKIMGGYLAEIEADLARRLPRARLLITKSNGGAMSAREARAFPVHTMLSGPAAGVTAARALGRLLELPDLLTMDMGGTSTDMSLIRHGEAVVSTQAEVGDFPLMMPVTAIEALGAGGGSVAWLDGRVLKVGPRSAGARPGPACYGRGGAEPTLTDAYLLCGYLPTAGLLGGRLPLDRERASAALSPIANALGTDVVRAAESCVTVGTSNMLAHTLPFLARLGVDPHELTLVLFGGAGAIHGPLLADELGIERVMVPRLPSVFCAFGCLTSDLTHDVVRTVHGLQLDDGRAEALFGELEREARRWMDQQTDSDWLTDVRTQRFAAMRYRGQAFDVDVAIPDRAFTGGGAAAIEHAFHRRHAELYGHADPEARHEFVEFRVRVVGSLSRPQAGSEAGGAATAHEPGADAVLERRAVRLGGEWRHEVPVLARDRLKAGCRFSGPALVEQTDAMTLVPAGFRAEVGPWGDLMLERERE
ncbi:MAG: hydantoinase/oxoprolinase family protein [Burkholderiales bacterium]|nr:MAG: hydantoinase/oxoprolinase family protein [Burkholderiales bacterium]